MQPHLRTVRTKAIDEEYLALSEDAAAADEIAADAAAVDATDGGEISPHDGRALSSSSLSMLLLLLHLVLASVLVVVAALGLVLHLGGVSVGR